LQPLNTFSESTYTKKKAFAAGNPPSTAFREFTTLSQMDRWIGFAAKEKRGESKKAREREGRKGRKGRGKKQLSPRK